MEPVKVRIHDQEYLLKSDGDVEQIEEIADYVNQKLADVQDGTEGLSDRKVAILAALSIAGEYLQARRERDEVKGRIRQRTDALINIIDSAIT
ncbi:MAG: cell division protein ZapA [Deltaproteobacteria bacterium]|nr:cell division protein ZapA [Deltaproteobacteria bacterium]MBW2205458.1 cell division protein ZapA [Deltaproteobacteria bacterium]